MTTETPEQKQRRVLEEARGFVRELSARLLTRIPPADLAGVLLVQSISVMHLESDTDVCVQWLRDLADNVEALGVDDVVSRQDLN
jgi:hypothetical protein